ncbi:sugar kinase [Aquibacillus sp. 3ASR75-11]|uniref:Sugar kinase n=1 Tax=Terrihalobacillus insolitus TaxID=2950438 RepID=A0A9X4AM33_9BACI|nr:sugar kinase [Terrihalobacillus insolitus]MDC3412193.1 sugar kinase [Terrihalobacillus insolitus]MDC3423113.1 sugar kinase [Terrihalobacillus insolitus]
MKKVDVVTFGETMVLFQSNQKVPLEYVHQFDKLIGGAESNVSIGLQRLGHSVGWFSKLGNDPFGRFILQFVRGEGVDTSACLFTDDASTGIFFKEKRSFDNTNVYYYRKNSAASLLKPSDLNEEYIANAKVLHLTGITPALSESCSETVFKAIEIAKRNDVLIVFDPNLRLKLWEEHQARSVFNQLAEKADVILPGLDEGEFMTGETTPEAIATTLIGNAKKTVIIKLGSKGSYYQTMDGDGYVPGFQVDNVVDPVGAGDGFAAGIISGILENEPLRKIVRRANAIGAMVVGVDGDVEGLPRQEEIEQFMNRDHGHRDVNR